MSFSDETAAAADAAVQLWTRTTSTTRTSQSLVSAISQNVDLLRRLHIPAEYIVQCSKCVSTTLAKSVEIAV